MSDILWIRRDLRIHDNPALVAAGGKRCDDRRFHFNATAMAATPPCANQSRFNLSSPAAT
ncbi:deoxyribodipyrimidine photo-lyase [Vibrio splendidus]|uniref:deoxyribodipyrimidine photo-lyase n=1 Tax=Vibrio splendidus TaxID=29497 RepID=UPI003BF90012